MKSRARRAYETCEGWMTIRQIEEAIDLPPTNRERQALKAGLGWLKKRGLAESRFEDGVGTLWRMVRGAETPAAWLDRPTAREAVEDGMTAKELARATGRTESSVASSLRKLEAKGLAWSEWSPRGRRFIWHRGPRPGPGETVSEGEDGNESRVRGGGHAPYFHMALRMPGGGMRDKHRVREEAHDMPLREPAQVEERAMASVPLVPCVLCDQVPGMPGIIGGRWRIVCPLCGREATGDFEADVRRRWAEMNIKASRPLSPALDLLDSIEAAMCDLEAIRQVPGAMDVWHRWMDDLKELRKIVEEAGEC